MSHVYQPVMIRNLLKNRGKADSSKIAKAKVNFGIMHNDAESPWECTYEDMHISTVTKPVSILSQDGSAEDSI